MRAIRLKKQDGLSIGIVMVLIWGLFGSFLHTSVCNSSMLSPQIPKNGSTEPSWNYTWSEVNYDSGRSIARDSAGNLFVGGWTEADQYSDGGDFVLVKYDPNGVQSWNRTWGGAEEDHCNAIAIDSEDYIYMVGHTCSYGHTNGEMCIVKYNSSGDFEWARYYNPSGYFDSAYGIAINESDTIFVTGKWATGPLSYDLFVCEYDTDGNQGWVSTWGNPGGGFEAASAIAVDPEGFIYIAGKSEYTDDDMVIIKWDSSGNQVWNRSWGSTGTDQSFAIHIPSSNNIYVTGSTSSGGTNVDDLFLLKYDNAGNRLWEKSWGTTGYEWGNGIDSDVAGNLYITGATRAYAGAPNYVVLLKYDVSGNLYWNLSWGSTGHDIGRDIVIDPAGIAYLAGQTSSYGAQIYDILLMKFESLGDIDEDGMSDVWEKENGLNLVSNDAGADPDGDTLGNLAEMNQGTDPNNSDSDGDGFSDGEEIAAGTDPKNSQDHPDTPSDPGKTDPENKDENPKDTGSENTGKDTPGSPFVFLIGSCVFGFFLVVRSWSRNRQGRKTDWFENL